MATLADALLTAIDTNWSIPTGGVEPTYKNDEDFRNEYPPNIDLVIARNWSHETRIVKINDAFEDRHHTITLTVSTADATDKEERLDELVNEVVRVLSLDSVVTGVDEVKLKSKSKRATNKKFAVWSQDLVYECTEYMASGSTAIGTAAVSSLTVDTLTVNTSISGTPTAALGATTTAALTASGNVECGDTKLYASSGPGNADIELADDAYIGCNAAGGTISFVGNPTTGNTICKFNKIELMSAGSGDCTISSADAINLKPSNDTDDYIQFLTDSDIPQLKTIGGHALLKTSDAGTWTSIYVGEDTTSQYGGLRYNKTTDNFFITNGTGNIQIWANGDTNDYFYFQTAANVPSLLCTDAKVALIASLAASLDNIWSDDFTNTSPFEEFENPLEDLKKIKPNKDKTEFDYTSLPDFVRAHSRDYSKNVYETQMVINEETGEEEEKQVLIERAPKDVIDDKGFSVNRMCVFLYQALQKALERIEALEAAA